MKCASPNALRVNQKGNGKQLSLANVWGACDLDSNVNTLSNSPMEKIPVLLACLVSPLSSRVRHNTRDVLFETASLARSFSSRVYNAFQSGEFCCTSPCI